MASCEVVELVISVPASASPRQSGSPQWLSAEQQLLSDLEERLRAWEARLSEREAAVEALHARASGDREASVRRGNMLLSHSGDREPSTRLGSLLLEGSGRGAVRVPLAHSGDWTVRDGALFTRAARSPGEWSVRGGSVYARMDARNALEADVAERALRDASPPSGAPPEAPAAAAAAEQPAAPSFLAKCCGGGLGSMPRGTLSESGASAAGATLGICVLAALQVGPVGHHGLLMLVASFGASAVLLFAAPASPLAQPRNLVVGNTLSALAGVCVAQAFGAALPWLAPALAVGLAIFLMCLAGVTHPPGGAFALIAVIGGPVVRAQAFLYALLPALSGSLVLLVVALLCNNVHPARQYPLRW